MGKRKKVEFIEEYIKVGNDYIWNDNFGDLVRCKNCVHRSESGEDGEPLSVGLYCRKWALYVEKEDFCSRSCKDTSEE